MEGHNSCLEGPKRQFEGFIQGWISDVLGLSKSFLACFGLPEQLNPGPENIKSGLNRAVRPPYGLKLFENVATGPRMSLEASNG